jgi:thioesterase domain-containing protein
LPSERETAGIDRSVQFVLDHLLHNGPYDGLLGFSQGAAMATRVAMLLEENGRKNSTSHSIRFLILIGGVNLTEKEFSYLEVLVKERKVWIY